MNFFSSIRYGVGSFELRKFFIKMCAWLQRKPVFILDSEPLLCATILASSDKKGSFIEYLFAIPAWQPIYSIESEDGTRWKTLSLNCCHVFRTLRWKDNLPQQVDSYMQALKETASNDHCWVMNAEQISRITLKVIYELLFKQAIKFEDETLFYRASIEWRKEIALKGRGDPATKQAFCQRLAEIVKASCYAEALTEGHHANDPMFWLSVFAQPFIISPQINVSDIMVAVFAFLRADPVLYDVVRNKAITGDDVYLNAVVMETIRLKHPFPILERELCTEMTIHGKTYPVGTQILLILDQFVQNTIFDPQSWLDDDLKHPFEGLIFGAGKRICLGKTLAKQLMVELLKSMLINIPDTQIQPQLGHLYSGRDNDGKGGFKESFYQMKIFGRAFWRSFKIGFKKST